MLLVGIATCAYSQKRYSNTIKAASNAFYMKDRHTPRAPFSQMGGFYERRVYRNWWVGAGYMKWKSWGRESMNKLLSVQEPFYVHGHSRYISRRTNYKMVDLYVIYKLHLQDKQIVNFGLGVSYCEGLNEYIEDIVVNPEDSLDAIIYGSAKTENDIAVLPSVGYSYLLFKNRVDVGIDVKCRYYFRSFPTQFDYGFHIGFNF
jgi:hypothetical protein